MSFKKNSRVVSTGFGKLKEYYMNFEEYKAKRLEEIDFVDFYVVKDFGKMGLMSLKVPYCALDLIGEETPIVGVSINSKGHTIDWPYRKKLTDEYELTSPRDLGVIVYDTKSLYCQRDNLKTKDCSCIFGENNVRIVITPIFNSVKYFIAVEESKEEQKRLTEKFISDAIVVCAGAESDMLLDGKVYKLMDKAVATHGVTQKALDYFDEFKFLID